MASITGTKTEDKSIIKAGEKQTAQRHDASVENSTDEFLGQNNKDRGVYDEAEPHKNFDPHEVENAAHALELGNAAYSANPPKKTAKRPGGGWASEDKDSKGWMEVKLLKDYGAGPSSEYKIMGSDQNQGANTTAGKIAAGTTISLPKEEALRFIKLGSAEAVQK